MCYIIGIAYDTYLKGTEMKKKDLIRLLKAAESLKILDKRIIAITGCVGYGDEELRSLDEVFAILIEKSKYKDDVTKALDVIYDSELSIEEKYKKLYKNKNS